MKKHSILVSVLMILALLSMATPTAVSAGGEPVGERIGVFYSGERVFTAGAPFYIMHGFMEDSNKDAIGILDFQLEVDGVLVREDFKIFQATSGDPDILTRYWVYNFPDGMTGTHTFIGHWYSPCQYVVNYTGTCSSPNEKVESRTTTVVVTFIP